MLDAVFGNSGFLGRCLILEPAFSRLLIEQGPDHAHEQVTGAARARDGLGRESQSDVMKRLRVAKRRAALTIALADIMEVWPLQRLTGALSEFAADALDASCRHLLRALHDSGNLALPAPDAPEDGSGLIVLGMGKLGAGELNYSSDIDIIVFFDDAVAPCTGKTFPTTMFARLARNLVAMMQERTPEGYVFRTDLQLRPDPNSTSLAMPVSSARQYYESVARTWERAAMIKACPVAGDIDAGTALIDKLRQFVWRRHLDFAAIQDIRSIKQRINAHRGFGAQGSFVLEGHNVKLGRGGIREIEFFAQTQQLVWGGRDVKLRDRGTLKTLDELVVAGHLAPAAATELSAAYQFHRKVEHRLQMIDDQQTHSLPGDEPGMHRLAQFLGFERVSPFAALMRQHIQTVERHYASLFESKQEVNEQEDLVFPESGLDAALSARITAMGYTDPARVSAIVQGWFNGHYAALRSDRARELLLKLVPAILRALATAEEPDLALLRFDRFLSRLSSGIQLLLLLAAHPALIGLVAEIMGSAPRLAEWLTHQPLLLESVLSRDFTNLDLPDDLEIEAGVSEAARRGLVRLFYMREFTGEEMAAQLDASVDQDGDFQDLLAAERRWANDSVFQVGVHMLRGVLSPVEAGRPLSDIAETCLRHLVPAIKAEFVAAHGEVPGGRIALVAFGKLGSREMTIQSDLDLLFLYDHDAAATESDGRRPLTSSQYYARLCRRLISAITSPTAEGKLYDVDMRLRPSGNSGPIACSLEAFVRYQQSSAWTWEHQAMTRARVILAEGDLDACFETVKLSVLARPRDPASLAGDVADMRQRLQREHGCSARGSIKLMPGGLMDVEFVAQFLQLLHGAEFPEILLGDPIAVFEAAAARGLVDAGVASEISEAARLWRNLQGILRLTTGQDSMKPDAGGDPLSVVRRLYGSLFLESFNELVVETAERVARHADTLLGPPTT